MRDFISGYFFKTWPHYTAIVLVNAINAAIPMLLVLYSARLVDCIMASQIDTKRAIDCIFMIGLATLWQRLSSNVISILRARQKAKAYPWVLHNVMERLASVQYAWLENSTVQSAVERIGEDPEEKLFQAADSVIKLVFFIVSNLSIFVLLATQEKALALFMLVLAFAYSMYAIASGKQQYETDVEVSRQRRKAHYFENILGNREALFERQLFQFGKHINKRYCETNAYARERQQKAKSSWYLRSNLGAYLSIVLSIVVIYALLQPVVNGAASIGMFVSLVTAFMNMANALTWHFPQLVKNTTTGIVCIKDYVYIYQIPLEKNELHENEAESISEFLSLEFRNVFFRYPESEVYVLKNMSFLIETGHHYAFVGKNGCGKTTIMKLIYRLYEPEAGGIYLNGKDIHCYRLDDVRKLFGVLFQDYARYPITIRENIIVSRDVPEIDESALQKSVQDNDLLSVIDRFSNGAETYLGKTRENAADLSGGEWQRLAMARVEYGMSKVKILDEPTAALDPVHEQKLYLKFMDIFTKQATITITHRLGATMTCDCIYVIDDGEVIERGTHDSLMAIDKGYYKSMYEMQRMWYE